MEDYLEMYRFHRFDQKKRRVGERREDITGHMALSIQKNMNLFSTQTT
jgi:hypothetical protein